MDIFLSSEQNIRKRSHPRPGGWKCVECEIIFRTRQELNDHKHNFHGIVFRPRPRKSKTCKYCGEQCICLRKHKETCPKWPRGPKKLSEEHRKKLSEAIIRWLKENPDKHPWKRKSKFKSVPCEKLKEELRKEFEFVEEYTDDRWSHNYSIDIAFLNKKIAVEVNGTQHYDRQGNLRPYYRERHDYLENQGWKIYEILYTWCFVEDKVNEIKDAIRLGTEINQEEQRALNENRQKTREEKQKTRKEKLERARLEGKLNISGKISWNKNPDSVWNERRDKILSCGVDLSKFGWVDKVMKITGLTKRMIEGTVKRRLKDFEGKIFIRKQHDHRK